MDYRKHIQRVIAYIEENLTTDMDNVSLAAIAGYSEYHFLRLFKEVVKLTPMDYIRKRRLTEIVKQMMKSTRSASDIAFEYGFNSKENFTRAFKAEHKILPTEFRTSKNSLKLYERIVFDEPAWRLEPQIITLPSFELVTYQSDESRPPSFWNKYNAKKWSLKLSGGEVVEDFGVSSWNSERNYLDYFIGIPKDKAHGDLSGTITLNITGGLYAMFETPAATHFDFVSTIHQTWDYIYDVWLPASGYCKADGYEFESYMEDSRTFSEKIYIPIREKG